MKHLPSHSVPNQTDLHLIGMSLRNEQRFYFGRAEQPRPRDTARLRRSPFPYLSIRVGSKRKFGIETLSPATTLFQCQKNRCRHADHMFFKLRIIQAILEQVYGAHEFFQKLLRAGDAILKMAKRRPAMMASRRSASPQASIAFAYRGWWIGARLPTREYMPR